MIWWVNRSLEMNFQEKLPLEMNFQATVGKLANSLFLTWQNTSIRPNMIWRVVYFVKRHLEVLKTLQGQVAKTLERL